MQVSLPTKEYFKYTVTFQWLTVIIRCISYVVNAVKKKSPKQQCGYIRADMTLPEFSHLICYSNG